MDPAEVSVNVSETEQQSDPEEQLDDSQPKSAYDPHGKRKKRSEIWDHFAQSKVRVFQNLLILVRLIAKFVLAGNLINLFNKPKNIYCMINIY